MLHQADLGKCMRRGVNWGAKLVENALFCCSAFALEKVVSFIAIESRNSKLG